MNVLKIFYIENYLKFEIFVINLSIFNVVVTFIEKLKHLQIFEIINIQLDITNLLITRERTNMRLFFSKLIQRTCFMRYALEYELGFV